MCWECHSSRFLVLDSPWTGQGGGSLLACPLVPRSRLTPSTHGDKADRGVRNQGPTVRFAECPGKVPGHV